MSSGTYLSISGRFNSPVYLLTEELFKHFIFKIYSKVNPSFVKVLTMVLIDSKGARWWITYVQTMLWWPQVNVYTSIDEALKRFLNYGNNVGQRKRGSTLNDIYHARKMFIHMKIESNNFANMLKNCLWGSAFRKSKVG